MIQTASGEVIITNDGATILKSISAMHPAARMVRRRRLQFVERGNGTRRRPGVVFFSLFMRAMVLTHRST